jgi:type IV pilus assembly protein PilF
LPRPLRLEQELLVNNPSRERNLSTGTEAVLRRLGLFFMTAVLATMLMACASDPGGGGATGSRADLQTSSDEPESRKRARIRLELAVGYFEQGKTTIALDELKLALAAEPNFPEAFNLRGLVYMRLNETQLAEESFRRALALRPGNGDILHNLALLQCQQTRGSQYEQTFAQAINAPNYGGRSKSLMMLGLCQNRDGKTADAERHLQQAYDQEPNNPVVAYNLSKLIFQRGEAGRAQFMIRRVNNGDFANAETLWFGIKVENSLNNRVAVDQLAAQLRRRFPQSRELAAFERGAFNE